MSSPEMDDYPAGTEVRYVTTDGVEYDAVIVASTTARRRGGRSVEAYAIQIRDFTVAYRQANKARYRNWSDTHPRVGYTLRVVNKTSVQRRGAT